MQDAVLDQAAGRELLGHLQDSPPRVGLRLATAAFAEEES
jgi:hypothetical protein